MLNLIVILTSLLFNSYHLHSFHQESGIKDSTNFFKRNNLSVYIGANAGWGFAGGIVRGGVINWSPRLGIAWKKNLIIGAEYSEFYQIEFQKDSIENKALYLNKWGGAFIRYYFSPNPKKQDSKFKLFILANAVTGSLFFYDYKTRLYESYNAAIVGAGASFKIKTIRIEGGLRITYLPNNKLNFAKQLNLIFTGISYVF